MDSHTLFDVTYPELERQIVEWGFERYRARQVWHAVYRNLAGTFHQIGTIPQALRNKLEDTFSMHSLKPRKLDHSSDRQTMKVLFELAPGTFVESVLMGYQRRQTACISSQAGCAMGCPFCATGMLGLQAQLSAGQIIEQAMFLARELKPKDKQLTNIVLMGMGEPFHNYDATIGALDRFNDPSGYAFGARRLTVSTVGIVPGIERFSQENRREKLAVSLHAADNELRDELVPINRKYPLEALLPACRGYVDRSGRRISFEWALIEGTNDGIDQARRLVKLLDGMICHVNLIPLNPTANYSRQRSSEDRGRAFRDYLTSKGIPCTIRRSRGVDIQAGCGQLAAEFSVDLNR